MKMIVILPLEDTFSAMKEATESSCLRFVAHYSTSYVLLPLGTINNRPEIEFLYCTYLF